MNAPNRFQKYQQSPQYQQLQQSFEEYTSNREIVAAAACALGGVLIMTLSLIGGAADVQWLERAGYSWGALAFYLLVGPIGIAIWRGVAFAPPAALGLVGFDMLLDIILSYVRFSDFPEWLIFLKVIVFVLVAQVIWQGDGDDEDQPQQQSFPPPGPPYQGSPPQQPMGRR